MEIRVLRYFLAVAREGNIAGAAAFLHLTQPTLSRQIRDLEEELGQTLLVRKSHGVALTAEGVLFRKRAEEILSMVDKTEAEFASMGEAVSGDIYIGGGETQAVRLGDLMGVPLRGTRQALLKRLTGENYGDLRGGEY